MEMEKQAYRWWFDSHNSARRSPWLHSTLAELDQKTKAMLRLIEEDADSFAQRAEMYYKKRPELISMVEDFYRAHRSLAERFDQLRKEHDTGTASTLALGGEVQKGASDLYKFCDSYNVEGYDAEDSGELSEVDDPEQEDTNPVGKDVEEELSLPAAVVNEEMTKLRKEIDSLKEENKIQIHIIQREERSKEELKMQLSGSRNEVLKLREEIERLQKEKTLIMMQHNDEKCDEMTQLREENEIQKQWIQRDEKAKEELRMQPMGCNSELRNLREGMERLQKENTLIMLQHENEKWKEMELRQEMEKIKLENKAQKDQLMQKDEDNREVTRQLNLAMEGLQKELRHVNEKCDEMARLRQEMEKLKLENRTLKEQLVQKDEEKRKVMRQLNLAMERLQKELQHENEKCDEMATLRQEMEKLKLENRTQKEQLMQNDEEKREAIRKLNLAMERLQKEKTLIMLRHEKEKCDEMAKVRREMEKIKLENRTQKEQLMQKDEEKREVIRQLSLAMERLQEEKTLIMLRHENEKCDEMAKVRQEMEKIKLENRTQKEQLMQKDEEKREVIRQLSLGMEMLREETLLLKKSIAKENPKKRSNYPFEFYRFKGLGKLFGLSLRSQTSTSVVVPL